MASERTTQLVSNEVPLPIISSPFHGLPWSPRCKMFTLTTMRIEVEDQQDIIEAIQSYFNNSTFRTIYIMQAIGFLSNVLLKNGQDTTTLDSGKYRIISFSGFYMGRSGFCEDRHAYDISISVLNESGETVTGVLADKEKAMIAQGCVQVLLGT